MRAVLGLLLLGGCPQPSGPPCSSDGDPTLEVTPTDAGFGTHEDGDPLIFGPPPQGGAPFAAIDLRVAGLTDMDRAVLIELSAVDLDTEEELGDLSYPTRLVCANVGDSAGNWLATDVHHRFYGWELDELPGRLVALTVAVTDTEDVRLEQTIEAVLEAQD